ncbi:MAG TPA: polymer-forming cytoskeletal protein [Thermoanaerobaculia bacterium]|jgi:cytoskeletal protein CcmA (bactofilin family)|nr:polymer-forming cytoskeletal protein [Thermoanaerobaculia bacterium]
MIFKSEGKQSDLNGFLDSGSHVQGELRFQTSFRVDGTFNGSVVSDGDLIVGDGGEVEGDLRVGQIIISGTVRGTVRASRRVHLSPSGKVFADVDTPSLIIEDGAVFEGRCSMTRESARAAGTQGAVGTAAAAGPKLVAQKVPAAREG